MTELRGLAAIDRIVHEPIRLAVIVALDELDSADFLYLLHETGATKGNLSTHLAKLEDAGHVAVEKTYRAKVPRTVYRLTDTGRAAFYRYLAQLRPLTGRAPR